MPPISINDRIRTLNEAVKLYEDKKLPLDIDSLNRRFAIEISFTIIIPVVATILSFIFINATAALAPITLGTVNAVEKLTVSKSLIATYSKDKDAIRSRPTYLYVRIKLAEAEPDSAKQNSILDYVQKTIQEYFPEVQVSSS